VAVTGAGAGAGAGAGERVPTIRLPAAAPATAATVAT